MMKIHATTPGDPLHFIGLIHANGGSHVAQDVVDAEVLADRDLVLVVETTAGHHVIAYENGAPAQLWEQITPLTTDAITALKAHLQATGVEVYRMGNMSAFLTALRLQRYLPE